MLISSVDLLQAAAAASFGQIAFEMKCIWPTGSRFVRCNLEIKKYFMWLLSLFVSLQIFLVWQPAKTFTVFFNLFYRHQCGDWHWCRRRNSELMMVDSCILDRQKSIGKRYVHRNYRKWQLVTNVNWSTLDADAGEFVVHMKHAWFRARLMREIYSYWLLTWFSTSSKSFDWHQFRMTSEFFGFSQSVRYGHLNYCYACVLHLGNNLSLCIIFL